MILQKVYKYQLDPNDKQRSQLYQHAGAARYVYNWGLAHIEGVLNSRRALTVLAVRQGAGIVDAERWAGALVGPVPWNAIALRREWNIEKRTVAPWWDECSKEAYANGLVDLANAYRNYFESRDGKRKGPRVRWPKYKRKYVSTNSYSISTGSYLPVDAHHIHLPKIGLVRVKEKTHKLTDKLKLDSAKLGSATVVEEGNHWYICYNVRLEISDPVVPGGLPVGVDVGVKVLLSLSNGCQAVNPRLLASRCKKIKRLQRRVSRRAPVPGERASGRYVRAKVQLGREHRKVRDARLDNLHKATGRLAGGYGVVVVEDLYIVGMLSKGGVRKAGLNRAISDAAMGLLLRQLEYKCEWRGGCLVRVSRWYPSSKRCSYCGFVKTKLGLGERVYYCDECGFRLDRDVNAARNLLLEGLRLRGLESIGTASGAGTSRGSVNAQGELVSGQELVVGSGGQGSLNCEDNVEDVSSCKFIAAGGSRQLGQRLAPAS